MVPRFKCAVALSFKKLDQLIQWIIIVSPLSLTVFPLYHEDGTVFSIYISNMFRAYLVAWVYQVFSILANNMIMWKFGESKGRSRHGLWFLGLSVATLPVFYIDVFITESVYITIVYFLTSSVVLQVFHMINNVQDIKLLKSLMSQ